MNKFNVSHNKLKLIEKEAFQSAPYLNTIDLSNNQISDLSNRSLCGIDSLTHLYLSHNQLRTEDVRVLAQCTKLEFLDVAHNRIATLEGDIFKDSTLKEIVLSDNQIREVDLGTFFGKNRINVHMEHNELKTLHGNRCMLSNFKAANNKIEKIESNTFENCSYLFGLDLSHNEISTVDRSALAVLSPEVNLQYNKIDSFDRWFVDRSGIRHLNVSHNRIERIEVGSLDGAKRLNVLDLSHNGISDIAAGALSSSSLNDLHLNHNRLTVLRNNALNLSHLYDLVVSFNKIKIVEPKAFDSTTKLDLLDLSYNEIEVLSPELFKNTTLLRLFYIQHNLLTVLQDRTFENCGRLRILDFSHNELVEIKWAMFPYFHPYSSSDYVLEASLSNNRISKERLESFVIDLIMNSQWNPRVLVNATLDGQSCHNFRKKGDCIVTRTRGESECVIEVKHSETCSIYNE